MKSIAAIILTSAAPTMQSANAATPAAVGGSVTAIGPGCIGDLNGDGVVDPLDVGFIMARLGCPVGSGDPDCDACDLNASGDVDLVDVIIVFDNFGECE